MNDIIAKISSYNIFNYMVPGSLFVIAANRFNIMNLNDQELVTKLLTFYIVGLIISRVGSLIIDPLMRATKLVRYTEYEKFVLACAKDTKLDVIVEVSNTYRTLATAFLLLLLGEVASANRHDWTSSEPWLVILASAVLMSLFLVSFSKQAGYVSRRVAAHTDTDIGAG